ncbi:methylase of polypeptide subunit release factors [Nocardioides daedukensis]|uniref:Methylase of polypeptide subunit release factors n=1 Tax=Nocardioides daedukensis TaxID=634462 RepID=A0A7Y9UM54_9ACTN|nr:class I SAM-dependent methyltransferase [Nocardioides daedukensis]NYG57163.1 methylase of polypeptide subunit release factors [Nocardioides daedukensis]
MRTPEPSPTMTQQAVFGDLTIAYDERVLTPRAWTTAQSAWVTELSLVVPDGPILELCTGAGHIGLLAIAHCGRDGVLVDLDPVACDFALANASSAGLAERVEVRRRPVADCLETGETFPLVVADPPWVPSARTGRFPEDPLLAIDGGDDGLALARACVQTIDDCLHPQGAAVLQIGSLAQADGLGDWMAGRVDLVVAEVRSHGERGVLALLRRPD